MQVDGENSCTVDLGTIQTFHKSCYRKSCQKTAVLFQIISRCSKSFDTFEVDNSSSVLDLERYVKLNKAKLGWKLYSFNEKSCLAEPANTGNLDHAMTSLFPIK